MAVTRVSSQIAEAETLTMPTHQQYDLAVAFAYRHNSVTEPTVPSGWRLRQASTGNSNGLWAYEKALASNANTFGTFTGATMVAVVVYRSDADKLITCGATNFTGQNSSTTVNFPAITNVNIGNINAFFLGAVGIDINSSDGNTAPSGMTNVVNLAGGSVAELAIHDTNAEATSWTSTSFTASGAIKSRSITLSVFETSHPEPTGRLRISVIYLSFMVFLEQSP